jgi:hypothetical protein
MYFDGMAVYDETIDVMQDTELLKLLDSSDDDNGDEVQMYVDDAIADMVKACWDHYHDNVELFR